MLSRAMLFLAALAGCSRQTPVAERAAGPMLVAGDAWLDRADRPREDWPLVAGEPVVFGLRISGGDPPYRLDIDVLGSDGKSALSATTSVTRAAGDGIEVGLGGGLAPDAAGSYHLRVHVTDAGGLSAVTDSASVLVVGGNRPAPRPVYPRLARMEIDQLALYGGEILRAPRAAWFRRGETVRIEARIGGDGGRPLSWSAALTSKRGSTPRLDLGPVAAAPPSPTARRYLQGRLKLSPELAPGPYTLDIEVRQGQMVTSIYRQLFVR